MRIRDGFFFVTGAASGLGAGVARLLAAHTIENTCPNGEVIRLDGAFRMQPK
jgi:NAD(P)-dependent dehydrogenase (short-subunit alcohol dehydrogenase family)